MREESFYESNMGYVIIYSVVSVSLARFKYYFGWKLSVASIHATGISFDGKKFERINTCDPLIVETSMHIREKISSWNSSVQEWLRKCIYQRATFKNKAYSQLFVFMVSAFWHGFYLGYYFSFFLWFAQVHLQGLIFKYSKN
jgi:lysophospholipid acyltransferase